MKRIAIIQSCYIPWRGFFDLVSRCDEYVIYDQVAFQKGHWHNRNKVKTARGPIWMTIPTVTHGRLSQPIEEVEIAGPWTDRHWAAIEQSYRHAPFFAEEAPAVRALYEKARDERLLTKVNELFMRALLARVEAPTRVTRDSDYHIEGSRSERVLSTCLAVGATHYLSGPSAKAYLDERLFAEAGVALEWMDYRGYRDYPQLHGKFVGEVSILDLLFNMGPDARSFLHPEGDDYTS